MTKDRTGELWAYYDDNEKFYAYFVVLQSSKEFKDISSHKVIYSDGFKISTSYEKDDTWENSSELLKIS